MAYHEGVVEGYCSLQDPLLAEYMKKPHVLRHLHKACMITHCGEILTDNSHRLLNAKLEQKEYSKSCLSSTFADPTYREHVRNHRQFIQKKLEELQRAENVQSIREETGQKRREVAPPLVIFDPFQSSHSSSAASRQSFHSNINGSGDVIHRKDGKKCVKTRSLPKKQKSSATKRPRQLVSAGCRQWSMATITLHYFGSSLSLDGPQMTPHLDSIFVKQQCCGANVRTLFDGKVAPNSNFTFISRRHVGCPFSLTLYVNGCQSDRITACCERRHTVGSRLGGQSGHFALVSSTADKPCYRCQVSGSGSECKPSPAGTNYSSGPGSGKPEDSRGKSSKSRRHRTTTTVPETSSEMTDHLARDLRESITFEMPVENREGTRSVDAEKVENIAAYDHIEHSVPHVASFSIENQETVASEMAADSQLISRHRVSHISRTEEEIIPGSLSRDGCSSRRSCWRMSSREDKTLDDIAGTDTLDGSSSDVGNNSFPAEFTTNFH